MIGKNTYVDIPGYEGYYVINKEGDVRSVDRAVPDKRLGVRNIKGVPIVKTKTEFGYIVCQLWKNKKSNNAGVHRLLALAFIKRSNDKTQVNHKNGVRDDNRLENLEWVTASENVTHGFRSNGRKSPVAKKVICINSSKVFESATEAAKEYGLQATSISAYCLGKSINSEGLKFKYINN